MSTGNGMSLTNATTDTTLSVFFLVTTNSGIDCGLVSGFDLAPGITTNQASFNVDWGDTDTFFILFQDQDGTFWQSQAIVANLSSRSNSNVSVTLAGTVNGAGGLGLTIEANGENFGTWPVFHVGTVENDASTGNSLSVYNASSIAIAVYFGVAMNSGQDIGVIAGTNLGTGPSRLAAQFNVDRGMINTFMILFVNEYGQSWWSNGTKCNLSSRENSAVQLIVSGDSQFMTLVIVPPDDSGPEVAINQIQNAYRPG
ncbi:MAG TPA: hypothetical protein VF846_06060 [Thermoanaerobaculia bacterium]|jgi:hypothetical protein